MTHAWISILPLHHTKTLRAAAQLVMLPTCGRTPSPLVIPHPTRRWWYRLDYCGEDGTIRLWDRESGKHVRTQRRDRPYERLNVMGIQGLAQAEITTLRALGAIEALPWRIPSRGRIIVALPNSRITTDHAANHVYALAVLGGAEPATAAPPMSGGQC